MTVPATSVDGRWQLLRAEQAGEQAPELVINRTTLVLRAGTYAIWFAGEEMDSGTFETGGVTGATTLLLRGSRGPNAGRTIPCIYQLRGDRLRICYGLDGTAPTEFTTGAQDHRYLASYQRMS